VTPSLIKLEKLTCSTMIETAYQIILFVIAPKY